MVSPWKAASGTYPDSIIKDRDRRFLKWIKCYPRTASGSVEETESESFVRAKTKATSHGRWLKAFRRLLWPDGYLASWPITAGSELWVWLHRASGDQRVTADTLFSVQSISKHFTTLGFLSAVDKGLVRLDEPVTNIIPGFRVHSQFGEHVSNEITLRQLLRHWSGLPHEAPVIIGLWTVHG